MADSFTVRFKRPLSVHTTNALLLDAYMHSTVVACTPGALLLFKVNDSVINTRLANIYSLPMFDLMAHAFPDSTLTDKIELGVNSGVHAENLGVVLVPCFKNDGAWAYGATLTIKLVTGPAEAIVQ